MQSEERLGMELTLIYNGKAERRTVTANEMMLLPRVEVENQTFLGWNRYERLHYGFMNISPVTDTVLHAICTDGAAYVIESHFRGVPNDSLDQRCQFRRYVIDVYLENVSASCGTFNWKMSIQFSTISVTCRSKAFIQR